MQIAHPIPTTIPSSDGGLVLESAFPVEHVGLGPVESRYELLHDRALWEPG